MYEAKVCKYGQCKDLNIRGRAFSDPYRGDGVVSLQLEMDRRSAKVGTTAKKYFVNSRFGPISCQNRLTTFPVADLRGFPSRAGFP